MPIDFMQHVAYMYKCTLLSGTSDRQRFYMQRTRSIGLEHNAYSNWPPI
jgi:hypothetical protein